MPPLTILGASSRAAAFSAARAGYSPYAIDSFADRDLAALCPAIRIERYPRDFLRALAAGPQGPWMYTGGLENHPRLIERLARIRPLWGNAAEVVTRVRDPWQLSAALDRAGLAFPPVARSATAGDWLVKPLHGSAGLGVRRANECDLRGAPRGTILQEYIAGRSSSAVYVAAGGRAVFLGATRQLLGRDFGLRREFLYAGSIGPVVLVGEERAKLERLGAVIAQQFGLVGLFGIDFVLAAGEIWPVEVNPRYSASVEILERASCEELIPLHAAACDKGRLPTRPPQFPQRAVSGKAIVYARQDSIVADHMPWNEGTTGHAVDLPSAGQQIAAGHPVATIIVQGPSLGAVEAVLRRRVQVALKALLPAST